jgi:hypothetical protein
MAQAQSSWSRFVVEQTTTPRTTTADPLEGQVNPGKAEEGMSNTVAPLLRRSSVTAQRVPDTEECKLNALFAAVQPCQRLSFRRFQLLHTHRVVAVMGPSVLWRRD